MKVRLIGVLNLGLALLSILLSYRLLQAQMCKAEILNILSLHYTDNLSRKVTLGELLEHGDIKLKSCCLDGGIELIWQSKPKMKTKSTPSIKLVDKAPTILYFKSDRRIYSWASSSKPLSWIPIAFPQIKDSVEK